MSESSEQDIEVTPEMIEAGYRVLCLSLPEDVILKADKCTVAAIFRAMLESRSAQTLDRGRH